MNAWLPQFFDIMPAVSKKPSAPAAVASSPSKRDAAAKPSAALLAVAQVALKGSAVAAGTASILIACCLMCNVSLSFLLISL